MLTKLAGYRTYICAIFLILGAGMHSLGFMSDASFVTFYSIFGGIGLAALRSAVNKLGGNGLVDLES